MVKGTVGLGEGPTRPREVLEQSRTWGKLKADMGEVDKHDRLVAQRY